MDTKAPVEGLSTPKHTKEAQKVATETVTGGINTQETTNKKPGKLHQTTTTITKFTSNIQPLQQNIKCQTAPKVISIDPNTT